MAEPQDSFTFTVGKLDAGMAILLGERAHLIEFPSILLPPGATTGSIVNIAVHQNVAEEKRRDSEFWSLQNDILESYGITSPENPKLELRNVTQTSVTLEWPTVKLATAKLRSLDIYRNGQRLAAIPSPLTNNSTKLSGLELNTEYSFQLVLRTTAGTFPSNLIRVRTHTITDTSGISVCFGNVQDEVLLENAKLALREMRAKWSDKIQIDTTHFVCTTPAATSSGAQATGNRADAPGVEYQRALQLSIPVVQPLWILACHSEKKMMPIASFYLGANPSAPINSGSYARPQSMSQANLPQASTNATTPPAKNSNRASMPAPSRVTSASPPQSTFINQPSPRLDVKAKTGAFEPTPEELETDAEGNGGQRATSIDGKRRSRPGTMDRNFKFPSSSSVSPPAIPDLPLSKVNNGGEDDTGLMSVGVVAPSSVEVPPPPPVEKEKTGHVVEEGEEDVGETEEIALN
jgi:hypothetical protein